MMRKHYLLPLALALWACSENGGNNDVAGGPGSETTNGIVAYTSGGSAPFASVALRKVDHMAATAEPENALVQADAYADAEGRFSLQIPEEGEFRLTVVGEGSAYSRVISAAGFADVDSVELVATSSMTGVVDIPEGSQMVWVGVLGTDILVRSDANGSFVLPTLPSNDSLQLYVVNEAFDEVLQKTEKVVLKPYQTEIRNFQKRDTSAVDTGDVEVPEDTVRKVVLLLEDGAAASYATVSLRSVSASAEDYVVQNTVALADLRADVDGRFAMEWPVVGDFRLTAISGNSAFSREFSAAALAKIDTLRLEPTSTVSSKVTLKSNEDFAWVGVYGLDILVKTSASGAYVLPNLPATDSLSLYFAYADGSKIYTETVIKPQSSGIQYLSPSMVLQDFEGDAPGWYLSVDTLKKGSIIEPPSVVEGIVYDKDLKSKVFHGQYTLADDDWAWALLGTDLYPSFGKSAEIWSFASVDSVEFYAKGDGEIRLALENWALAGPKAASDWIPLKAQWKRIVLKPTELCVNSSERVDCIGAWDSVKNHVKQLTIFVRGGEEFFVDDIRIHGVLF